MTFSSGRRLMISRVEYQRIEQELTSQNNDLYHGITTVNIHFNSDKNKDDECNANKREDIDENESIMLENIHEYKRHHDFKRIRIITGSDQSDNLIKRNLTNSVVIFILHLFRVFVDILALAYDDTMFISLLLSVFSFSPFIAVSGLNTKKRVDNNYDNMSHPIRMFEPVVHALIDILFYTRWISIFLSLVVLYYRVISVREHRKEKKIFDSLIDN